jgi:hypothetical protein
MTYTARLEEASDLGFEILMQQGYNSASRFDNARAKSQAMESLSMSGCCQI